MAVCKKCGQEDLDWTQIPDGKGGLKWQLTEATEFGPKPHSCQNLKCKDCGRTGLKWTKTDDGWRLCDSKTGEIHDCKIRKDKKRKAYHAKKYYQAKADDKRRRSQPGVLRTLPDGRVLDSDTGQILYDDEVEDIMPF